VYKRQPRARTGVRSKSPPFKRILYHVDKAKGTAVIGHVLLPTPKQDKRVTPMEAHEFGKRVTTVVYKKHQKTPGRSRSKKQKEAYKRLIREGRIQGKDRRSRARRERTTMRVKMPKRRFARPALLAIKKKFGQFWKNCVNRSTIKSGGRFG
jgi:hypothetical protein